MENPQERFRTLLRDLFQFDCADLDFGIYRIMNRKRALLADFVDQQPPADIRDALSEGARVLDAVFKERMFAPVNA